MATKKYQIQQRTGENTYEVLHPETDASIVKINSTETTYTDVEDAVIGLESRLEQAETNIDNIQDKYVTGVKGSSESTYRTGNVNITPANIGLGNVNNTSDASKPISTAQNARFSLIEQDVSGLSEDVTALKNKVSGLSGPMDYLGTSKFDLADSVTAQITLSDNRVYTFTCD